MPASKARLAPVCRDENMLLGVLINGFLASACAVLLALIIAVGAGVGCGSTLYPTVSVNPQGLTPSEQFQTESFVYRGIAGANLKGWRIGVLPYPLRFDPPILTGDFGIVTSATSITFLDRHEIVLTWRRLPDGSLDVEDLPWELSKVRDFAQRNP